MPVPRRRPYPVRLVKAPAQPAAAPVQPGYTLVRFLDATTNLTGIAQVVTAGHALQMIDAWQTDYPEHQTVVFDHAQQPVSVAHVAALARMDPATETFVLRRRSI